MSSGLAFIPRSVAKGATRNLPKDRSASKPTAHVPQESPPGPSTTHLKPTLSETQNVKRKEDELLILMEAALSDYSCWCNAELRHEMKSGKDGYISLNHVLAQSTMFGTVHPRASEADLMRCIRASPNSILETRMLISEPSRSEWFNRGPGASTSYQSDNGGFEVRRKDWNVLLQTIAESGWNKDWWDQRTIYIERLPTAYYSINALGRYIQSLLSPPTTSRKIQVQSITFPPHYLAARDKPSRCKGFAFIVLESPALVEILCQTYPWDTPSSVPSADKEAIKSGMRILPKGSWEKLKAEYLAYQQHLLSKVAEEAGPLELEAENHNISSKASLLGGPDILRTSSPPPIETEPQPSWFPRNCLVFVRNIHPETNKTTLRTLFSVPLTPSKGFVDYVDFSKGLDTCHLRLGSPSDATLLVSHFTTQQHTAQLDALDQVGAAPTRERPMLELEIVRGKREELYWEKVPEKVRTAAVARLEGVKNYQAEGECEDGRRPKRRKKG